MLGVYATEGHPFLRITSGGVYVACIYHTCQVRVKVDDSGLHCCTCVTYFERQLTPSCVGFVCA